MDKSREYKLFVIFKVVVVTMSVYVVFKYMLPVVLPFILAYGLCRWIYPLVVRIHKKIKLPVGLLAVVLISVGAVAFFGILFFAGKYLLSQLDLLLKNMDAILIFIQEVYERLCGFLGDLFRCDESLIYQWFSRLGEKIGENAHVWLMNFFTDTGIPFLKNIIVFIVIVMVAMIGAVLLIKNKRQIDRQIRRSDFSVEISEISAKVWQVIGCFLRAQMIIILLVAAICTAGLMICGIPYAVIIGAVIGIMDALPVIGSGTILVPWAVILLFMSKYKAAVILLIVYGLCACVRELLEARLMGSRLGINEFYMLMATFVGISLFGFSGIILGPLGVILVLEILKQIRSRSKTIIFEEEKMRDEQ